MDSIHIQCRKRQRFAYTMQFSQSFNNNPSKGHVDYSKAPTPYDPLAAGNGRRLASSAFGFLSEVCGMMWEIDVRFIACPFFY